MAPSVQVTTMEMRELLTVLLQVLPEQLQPLRDDVREVGRKIVDNGERTAKLESAVIGNGSRSLQLQISDLKDSCAKCRETIKEDLSRAQLADTIPDPELVKSTRLRERLAGARWLMGILVASALAGFEAVRFYGWIKGQP